MTQETEVGGSIILVLKLLRWTTQTPDAWRLCSCNMCRFKRGEELRRAPTTSSRSTCNALTCDLGAPRSNTFKLVTSPETVFNLSLCIIHLHSGQLRRFSLVLRLVVCRSPSFYQRLTILSTLIVEDLFTSNFPVNCWWHLPHYGYESREPVWPSRLSIGKL